MEFTVSNQKGVIIEEILCVCDNGFQVNFCYKTKVPILGVVENMSKFVCPNCNHTSILFPSTTGECNNFLLITTNQVELKLCALR